MQRTASALGVELVPVEVKMRDDIEPTIATVATRRTPALVAIEDPLIISNAPQIARFALQNRLPLIGFKPQAEAGALMEYGADTADLFHRSASFVDKILKGTPPANLPIERAVKFELVVNLKTAKTLGVTVPLDSNRQRRRGDRMKRREFISLLGGAAAAWPLAARAQQPAKLPTIGYLGPNTRSLDSQRLAAFVQRLRELGWIEGHTIAIEYRWAEGRTERLAEFAAEFVGLKAGVIVTSGTPPVIAAKQATSSIPIVFAAVGDPVNTGLITSLARPGGNVTGLSIQATDLAGKRLELLREVVPGMSRLAILANAGASPAVLEMAEVQTTARSLGLEVVISEIRRPEDIAPAFEAFKGRAEALYVCNDPLVTTNRNRLNTLALGIGLPTIYNVREFVDAGGLMSYGPNFLDLYRRAADFVDKILRGAKPADIPVEQPTKFELVINLTTAKALDLEVPPALVARADEVIE